MWTDKLDKLAKFLGGSKGSDGSQEEALIETFYHRKLMEVAVSRFEWKNLPEEIDVRFLERTLHFAGLVVFFKHDAYDKYFALRGNGSGNMNVYDNFTEFQVHGNGIMSQTLKYAQSDMLKECVPIWENPSRMPATDVVSIYAKRLARVDRTLDINALSARQPKILRGSPNMNLSKINFMRQMVNGAEFILLTDQLADSVETLDMSIDPDTFEKMHAYRARLYNECMGFLGIDNANQEKKERLIEGEVEANEEQTDVARATALDTRRQAAEEINRRYKLNIEVDYRGKLPTLDEIAPIGATEIV